MKLLMDLRKIGETHKSPFALSLSKCPCILSLSFDKLRMIGNTGSARTGGGRVAESENSNASCLTT